MKHRPGIACLTSEAGTFSRPCKDARLFNVTSEVELQDQWNKAGISAHHRGIKDDVGLCAAANEDASCTYLHGSLGVRDAQTKAVALPIVCSIN